MGQRAMKRQMARHMMELDRIKAEKQQTVSEEQVRLFGGGA